MIVKVYSIFDSKLATYGRPWYEMTDSAAIRAFSDAISDGSNPNNQFHKHPEDFSLYYLGDYDDQKGTFDVGRPPVSLVTASAIVASRRNGGGAEDMMPPELVDSLSKKR